MQSWSIHKTLGVCSCRRLFSAASSVGVTEMKHSAQLSLSDAVGEPQAYESASYSSRLSRFANASVHSRGDYEEQSENKSLELKELMDTIDRICRFHTVFKSKSEQHRSHSSQLPLLFSHHEIQSFPARQALQFRTAALELS